MKTVGGKVCLITGGAGGIGLAMVKELLNNGARGITIVDVSEEAGDKAINKIVSTFGENKAIFITADVTIKEELKEAFEMTIKTYNQLDIVINNAGIANEKEWEKTIAVNLTAVIQGTYLAMQEYLPKFKSGEEGVIVNTASMLGICTYHKLPIYCTTKHGLIGLGQALGGEEFYEKYKVRVLTICPGLVKTPLLPQKPKDVTAVAWEKTESEFRTLFPVLQLPERVGEALIEVVKEGKNGSLWVIENDEPVYEIVVPMPQKMRVPKE